MLDFLETMYLYEGDDGQGAGAGQEPKVEGDGEPKEPEKPVEPTEKQPTRNEILRELSKEHGVNLFDAEGLKQFKEYTESQKTETDKLQEQLSAYEEEKAKWQTEKLKYESQIKASNLGIHPSNLEDALKLAEGDPDRLEEVVKKYPMFKSKEGIKIGVQDPNTHQEPTDKSEVEAYMERHYKNNPYYKK